MNYLKKMSTLLTLIEQGHTKGIISADITHTNFMRLVDGDLKHIGDAIIAGKTIVFAKQFIHKCNFSFDSSPECYTIKQNTRTVFGVEVELLEDSDFDKEGFCHAYLVQLNKVFSSKDTYCVVEFLAYKTCIGRNIEFFKNYDDANKVAEAMNKLIGV